MFEFFLRKFFLISSKFKFVFNAFKSFLTVETTSFFGCEYVSCAVKKIQRSSFSSLFNMYCKYISLLCWIIYLSGTQPSSKYNNSFGVEKGASRILLSRPGKSMLTRQPSWQEEIFLNFSFWEEIFVAKSRCFRSPEMPKKIRVPMHLSS